jgi:hypothetical protein
MGLEEMTGGVVSSACGRSRMLGFEPISVNQFVRFFGVISSPDGPAVHGETLYQRSVSAEHPPKTVIAQGCCSTFVSFSFLGGRMRRRPPVLPFTPASSSEHVLLDSFRHCDPSRRDLILWLAALEAPDDLPKIRYTDSERSSGLGPSAPSVIAANWFGVRPASELCGRAAA